MVNQEIKDLLLHPGLYDSACNLMDDEIAEKIAGYAPTKAVFLAEYAKLDPDFQPLVKNGSW